MSLYHRAGLVPHRLLDNCFGNVEHHFAPYLPAIFHHPLIYSPFLYPPSEVKTKDIDYEKDKFVVRLDVQHFAPEEITVKTVKNTIVVEGQHDEKRDEHGFVSRHFVRRYDLPDEYEIKEVKSNLSSDGILTITAPKIASAKQNDDERYPSMVPITQTGPHHGFLDLLRRIKNNVLHPHIF